MVKRKHSSGSWSKIPYTHPLTGVYWYRETHKYTNIKLLNLYVKDKNVYLIKQN